MEGFFNFVSLENKIRYTLGKDERLKSRKAIDLLFKEGRSFSLFPFRVLYMFRISQPLTVSKLPVSPLHNLQTGFSVSSRHFKKAVDRNRVKRLMREAYRLQKNELQILTQSADDTLLVFFIYTGKEVPEYELVHEKTALVLKKLFKLTSENNTSFNNGETGKHT